MEQVLKRDFSKNYVKLLGIAVLLFSMTFWLKIDIYKIIEAFIGLSLPFCCLIVVLFMCNFMLTVTRTFLSYRQFGVRIPYGAAAKALLAGQVGAVVPVFGGVIGQSLNLSHTSNIASSTSSFIYFFDKILMALSGATLSVACAAYLFRHLHLMHWLLGETNNTSLPEFLGAIALSFVIAFFMVVPKADRSTYQKFLNVKTLLYLGSVTLINVCTWSLSALCTTLCLMHLNVNWNAGHNFYQVFLACIIVSFIASIPLSVNGWGIREFAAISILPLVSVPKEIALVSAITIGVLSMLALVICGLGLTLKSRFWGHVAASR